ncbi:G-protein coupled receptor moody [Holothuria leucospilota]|uniref:G-protein coupled receptor moody n=1 Tax=Holothuria leucospilota TaxID=206669 RepID=A0A9Q0YQR0_HOLLE|nr:G-protein coupled receptor moody [Holothuria leucospilota]
MMDVATSSEGNISGFIPPTPEHYVLGGVYALISVLGMAGNFLVILAVWRHRSLQNSTNAFIVNLAFADLLTSALLPIYVASFWTTTYTSSMDSFCALSTGLLRAFVSCSTLSLAAISINRLVIVTQAKRTYRWLFTRRRIVYSIFVMWIYGILLSFSTHFTGFVRLGFDVTIHQCGVVPISPDSLAIGHGSHSIGTFPLQFFIVLVCYAWIYLFVFRHNRRMQKHAESEPAGAISGAGGS